MTPCRARPVLADPRDFCDRWRVHHGPVSRSGPRAAAPARRAFRNSSVRRFLTNTALLLLTSGLSSAAAPRLESLPGRSQVDGLSAGTAWDVAADPTQTFSCVAMGSRGLGVLGTNFSWVSSVTLDGFARRLALSGNLVAVAAEDGGLHLVDVSNRSRPRRTGTLRLGPAVSDVLLNGTLAVAADSVGGLHVVDVSDPAVPRRLGGLEAESATPSPLRLARAGDLVLAADPLTGLVVVDLSRPAEPRRVGRLPLEGGAVAVRANGTLGYVATGLGRLVLADLSDPTRPAMRSSLGGLNRVTDLDTAFGHVYLGHHAGLLSVVDARDPDNLRLVPEPPPQVTPFWQIAAVRVAGRHLLCAIEYGSTWSLQLTDPARPLTEDLWNGDGVVFDLAIDGDLGAAALQFSSTGGSFPRAHLVVLDFGDPAAPRSIASLPDLGGPISVCDGRLYVAWAESQSVEILAVRGEPEPRRIGTYRRTHINDLEVVSHRAYLAVVEGLEIVDLTIPDRGRRLGGLALPGVPTRLAIDRDGTRVCLLETLPDNRYDLVTVDVTDPGNARKVSSTPCPGTPFSVAVDHGLAALLTFTGRIGEEVVELYDLTKSPASAPLARIPVPPSTVELALRDGWLTVLNYYSGLSIYAVRDPGRPRLEFVFSQLAGGRVHVGPSELALAAGSDGVVLLRNLPWLQPSFGIRDVVPGQSLSIEWSSSPEPGAGWNELTRVTPTASAFRFVDETPGATGAERRFYRARQ